MGKVEKFFGVLLSIFQYMILPPAVFALGAWLVWGKNSIVPAFLFSFSIDLLVGLCVNAYASTKSAKIAADLEKERMDYERGHVVGVSCPKCGERNLIPLDMRIEGFTCKACGQKSKLFYEFRAESIFDLQREDFNKDVISKKLEEDIGRMDAVWDELENA